MKRLEIDLTYNDHFYTDGKPKENGIELCGDIIRHLFNINNTQDITVVISSTPIPECYKAHMHVGSLVLDDVKESTGHYYWIMDYTTAAIAQLRPEILIKPFYISILV